MGSCSHVLSCQVMNVFAPRLPDAGRAYPVAEAPGRDDQVPGSLLGRGRRGDGQIGSNILSTQSNAVG
jgi:hypothetical protein